MGNNLGDYFSKFQTLIVGGLGFIGVIATLAMNAWLGRRQHARQVQHERAVLRTALTAELEILAEAYRDRVEMVHSANPGRDMLAPLDAMTDVYGRLVDRIGLLSKQETGLVMRAYILVRQMPQRLNLLAQRFATEEEKALGFPKIDSEYFTVVRMTHESFLTEIQSALRAIRTAQSHG
jgi:hypothetical protein